MMPCRLVSASCPARRSAMQRSTCCLIFSTDMAAPLRLTIDCREALCQWWVAVSDQRSAVSRAGTHRPHPVPDSARCGAAVPPRPLSTCGEGEKGLARVGFRRVGLGGAREGFWRGKPMAAVEQDRRWGSTWMAGCTWWVVGWESLPPPQPSPGASPRVQGRELVRSPPVAHPLVWGDVDSRFRGNDGRGGGIVTRSPVVAPRCRRTKRLV